MQKFFILNLILQNIEQKKKGRFTFANTVDRRVCVMYEYEGIVSKYANVRM